MQLDPLVQQVIVWLIGLIVGWFGPRPLRRLYDALGLEGQWAAVATVVIAVLVGAVGTLGATTLGWQPTDLWSLALMVLLASQFSYNRLKDQGAFAS